MIEKVIFLDDIDPVVLLGPNNRLLDLIQSYFPKIKLVATGKRIEMHGGGRGGCCFCREADRTA